MLLEVIATTVEDAVQAEQGGAARIELVRDLERGYRRAPRPRGSGARQAARAGARGARSAARRGR